ncbi:MAG: alpha/beta hydrolase [Rubrivivax sp.]|nr:alpha/beta hydrolase [Rubrivivax sp.]
MSHHAPAASRHRIAHLLLPFGPRLEFAEQGPPPGPGITSVLMLHGITDTWRSFEPVLPHLPTDWHVVSLSQRGHGGSDQSPHEYRTRDFAADAATFLQVRGMAPAIVVGHSMGAANAMRLAIDRPELVRGLVAAGGFASFGDKPQLVEFIRTTIATLGDAVPRDLADGFQHETVSGTTAPGLIETMVDECLRTPAKVWRLAFAGLLEDDFSALIGRIAAPTLLPWGNQDSFVPESDQWHIVRAIRAGGGQAERTVYEGTGHALHWERPERFARDLVRFVAGLPVPQRHPHQAASTAEARSACVTHS